MKAPRPRGPAATIAFGIFIILIGAGMVRAARRAHARDQRLLDRQAEEANPDNDLPRIVYDSREVLLAALAADGKRQGVGWAVLSIGSIVVAGGIRWRTRRAPRPFGGSRAPAVGTTRDLVALPVAMVVLTLLVWEQLPWGADLVRANAAAIAQRRRQVLSIVATSDPDSVRSTGCVAPVVPAPRYGGDSSDRETNTLILGPYQLGKLRGRSAWADTLKLDPPDPFLSLPSLSAWRDEDIGPAYHSDNKMKASVRAVLEAPYLVLYRSVWRAGTGVVQAALYDIDSGRRLCELVFETDALGWKALQQLRGALATLTGGSF